MFCCRRRRYVSGFSPALVDTWDKISLEQLREIEHLFPAVLMFATINSRSWTLIEFTICHSVTKQTLLGAWKKLCDSEHLERICTRTGELKRFSVAKMKKEDIFHLIRENIEDRFDSEGL